MASALSMAAAISASVATTIPSSSPSRMSPGLTVTSPSSTGTLTSGMTMALAARGVAPRAYIGMVMRFKVAVSRQKPSMTMPATPRRAASLANSSPATACCDPPAATTSTSPGPLCCSAPRTDSRSSRAFAVTTRPSSRLPAETGLIAAGSTRSDLFASDTVDASSRSSRDSRLRSSRGRLDADIGRSLPVHDRHHGARGPVQGCRPGQRTDHPALWPAPTAYPGLDWRGHFDLTLDTARPPPWERRPSRACVVRPLQYPARPAGTTSAAGCLPAVSAPDGHGMILIERRVDLEDATYRVLLVGLGP